MHALFAHNLSAIDMLEVVNKCIALERFSQVVVRVSEILSEHVVRDTLIGCKLRADHSRLMVFIGPVILDDLRSRLVEVRVGISVLSNARIRMLKLANITAGRLDSVVQVLSELTEVVIGILTVLQIGPELVLASFDGFLLFSSLGLLSKQRLLIERLLLL